MRYPLNAAVFTLSSVFAAATHRTDTWLFWASVGISLLMFLVAGYAAWRKEYLANISGPEIVISWRTRGWIDQIGQEEIEFQNIGTQRALNVKVEGFSRPDLEWHHVIEIPSLDPGERRSVRAEFTRSTSPHHYELGNMERVLGLENATGGVSFAISYSNLRRTNFRRKFALRLSKVGPEQEINAEPGTLTIDR